MILTNDAVEGKGTSAAALCAQSDKHSEVEPIMGHLHSQLRALEVRRSVIQKRILMIRKAVVGLAGLFGSYLIDAELHDLLSSQSAHRSPGRSGLTDQCRRLLREASGPLTLRQILTQVSAKSALGFPPRHPENSLRVILKRLVEYGEAEAVLTGGIRAWKVASGGDATRGHRDDTETQTTSL